MAESTVENVETLAPAPKKTNRKAGPGRPTKEKAEEVKAQSQIRFWDRLRAVSKDDWGARAKLYLYRLEPYTDRRRSGEHVYVIQYQEAVNEDRIMFDHGSGRYRLMLSFSKPSGEKADEIARHEFEILNQNYPPKIPAGEWVDDPRNQKWSWARPKVLEPGTPAQTQTPVSALRDVLEVNQMIREQAEDLQPPPQKSETEHLGGALGIVKTVLELAGPSKGDAVLSMLQAELIAIREQGNKKDDRIEKLIDELRKKPDGPPPVDPMKAMLENAENWKKMKELFAPERPQEQQNNPRSRMPWWAELIQPAVTEIAGSLKEIIPAVMNRGPQPQPKPAMVMQQPAALPPPTVQQQPQTVPNGAVPAEDPQPFMEWMFTYSVPMLTFCFDNEETGEDFANWMYQASGLNDDGTPYWTHPGSMRKVPWLKIAKELKVENLMTIYKQSPFWPLIASKGEEQFAKFLGEFIAWEPPKEDPEPADNFFPEQKEVIV